MAPTGSASSRKSEKGGMVESDNGELGDDNSDGVPCVRKCNGRRVRGLGKRRDRCPGIQVLGWFVK